MAWIQLTLRAGPERVPIAINMDWVVSLRRVDSANLTQLRVNGVVGQHSDNADNLTYIVEETPEEIWTALGVPQPPSVPKKHLKVSLARAGKKGKRPT